MSSHSIAKHNAHYFWGTSRGLQPIPLIDKRKTQVIKRINSPQSPVCPHLDQTRMRTAQGKTYQTLLFWFCNLILPGSSEDPTSRQLITRNTIQLSVSNPKNAETPRLPVK